MSLRQAPQPGCATRKATSHALASKGRSCGVSERPDDGAGEPGRAIGRGLSLTASRSARTIQRAYIPSAGRREPGGVPDWKFSITTPAEAIRSRSIARSLAFKVQHDAALVALQYGIGRMPPAVPVRRVHADDLVASSPTRYWPKSMTRMPSRYSDAVGFSASREYRKRNKTGICEEEAGAALYRRRNRENFERVGDDRASTDKGRTPKGD